ncbi:MAG TPA: LON peptidase substrate-binding domain-containing protein, partial [Thermoanaerobaculia bacterium]
MSESHNLPVVPMRNSVLFPGVGLPINAGRPGTLRAIEAAMKATDKRVFAVAQRQESDDVAPENLYTIGTIATIGSLQRGLGGIRLLLEG